MSREDLQRRAALHHHLSGNLYPPMTEFFDCALAVINGEIDEDGFVPAPKGIFPPSTLLVADEVIQKLRLEDFMEDAWDTE